MSDYSDNEAKRRYEIKEKQRLKNLEKNLAEGKSLDNIIVKGKPVIPQRSAPKDMSETRQLWKDQKKATNIADTIKKTPDDTIGIDPKVRNKSKFFRDTADTVVDELDDAAKLAKNSKGFAKLIPLLGLGTAGLAASSIFNKAKAGDIAGASLESADELTDLIPSLSAAKAALLPSEIAKESDKPDLIDKPYDFSKYAVKKKPAFELLKDKLLKN